MSGGCRRNSMLTLTDLEHLAMSGRLDSILSRTVLLRSVQLDRLTSNDQRLCFYVNLLNLMLIHSCVVCSAVHSIQVHILHISFHPSDTSCGLAISRCRIIQLLSWPSDVRSDRPSVASFVWVFCVVTSLVQFILSTIISFSSVTRNRLTSYCIFMCSMA